VNMEILSAVIVLGVLGAVFGLWLGFVQKMFLVKKDPRIEHVFSLLPGSNCGACGKAGCYGLAEALAKGEVDTIACPVVHEKEKKEIATTLGMDIDADNKKVATLLCQGGIRCKDNFEYTGIKDCNIALLVSGGPKACAFGCMGFGSCQRVCPFGAITMGDDKLPKINIEKCTGCGKCVKTCPKGVLVMVPVHKKYIIACNSHDKGPDTIKACRLGCIACGKCIKICPEGAISLKDNRAIIDYEKCINCGKCIEVCPTKAIIKRTKAVL
jgi:Na+-translocating ferredoxin:NAD+ oxidoreductase subunit B